LNKSATLLRKYQGREALENLSRDVTFSIGKELARANITAARSGDAKGKKWLEKFGRLVEGDVLTKTGPELEDALNQMAKNMVDRVQGTYGGRGLPASVMEGSLSPFLSLQKWGIEKSNVIWQDVVKPAVSGENYIPLLSYTLGSMLTGVAIQELNKVLTGRKPQEATWSETLAEPSIKNIAAEFATLAQLGSLGGIVSDGLKFVTDVSLKGKAPRNIVSFPLATATVNLQEKLSDYSEAIQQGTNPWDATKALVLDIISHNIQTARMVANYTLKDEELERSDKFRDLRVYRELTGTPSGEPTKSNKYLDMDARRFKRGDIDEAVEELPGLVESYAQKAQENPEEAQRYLRGLKANSYQTMPSPVEAPLEFGSYMDYLEKTQGADKASERLEDYMVQSAKNKVKTKMLPAGR